MCYHLLCSLLFRVFDTKNAAVKRDKKKLFCCEDNDKNDAGSSLLKPGTNKSLLKQVFNMKTSMLMPH